MIEVKTHGAEAVKFHGSKAWVRYGRVWKDASEQSHEQLYALKACIKSRRLPVPFISNLLLFPNLREHDLPERPHNIIGGEASFAKILNVLGEIANPFFHGEDATISAGKPNNIDSLLNSPLFRSLQPTPLDRRRMDRISRTEAWRRDWFDDLGERQVIFRGRGGAGKTVILLQLAHRAFDEFGARSLILTYNKALIADMRRTMALLGMPSDIESGGIAVDSIMSLIGRIFRHFNLLAVGESVVDNYEAHCSTLADFLANGDISPEDITKLKRAKRRDLDFDHVFIDEGQDWQDAEIQIIRALYPAERLVVADGLDQFVRGHVADWTGGVDKAKLQKRRLRRCLRMKTNLASFANAVARELGLETWSVEPNDEAGGGRVIIVEGDYLRDLAFHDQLVAEARDVGNHPVDLLMCIPPKLAGKDGKPSIAARRFQDNGQRVWDGTVRETRQGFPESREQLRIVQYDSCRGLEGWTVFALGFDDFWDYKINISQRSTDRSDDLFSTRESAAHELAARWAMIPLTRAMDTLLLQVRHRNTYAGAALRRVAERYPDFIEWRSSSR